VGQKCEASGKIVATRTFFIPGANVSSGSRTHPYMSMTDFDSLYRQHVGAVFRFAVRCVGRRDVAEELTSDAFLALHQHLDSIDTTQLPSWLFTVVRNKATDHWRRDAREQNFLTTTSFAVPRADAQETVEAWVKRNAALKPVHRLCIVLRYVYGMTRAEIAQQLGLTDNQVKGHLQYGLSLMRREMEKTG
jgi:RNA polymerase sigma-70 factor (ECF subfamily)